MNKKAAFTFRGVNQDISKSKHSNEYYYEGNNIRISATDSQSTGSVTNEKGNKLVLSIPTPSVVFSNSIIVYGDKNLKFKGANTELEKFSTMQSGEQIIIGHTNTRDSIILFSTDDNGFDCIWEFKELGDDNFDITLLYLRDLGFSTKYPIQALYNYENDRIQKVYWVDGKNQLRFLNTKHSIENEFVQNLIDINSNTINIVGNFDISQPKIIDVLDGGTHTSGMIQYTYNLYRLNSAQTKLSPMSRLIPLDKGKGQGGGEVNEIVGTTPIIEISDLDKEYTHIKVYAIKYTSYNQIPTVSLIKDKEINSNRKVTVFDDGNVIQDMSISELLFLGGDPISPKHIESKDNYLFSSNIQEKAFDIDLDTRAYSFTTNGGSIYDNVRVINGRITGDRSSVSSSYIIPDKHDAVNLNYDTHKYQRDNVTLGGEGKYLKYELVQDTTITDNSKQFLKDNEIYRTAIHFYNRLGQKSLPKWIADFRAPEGNLEGKYNTLRVTLKPEFYVWLNTSSNFESEDDKPIGYKILRANRTPNDRTIIAQGFLNGMMSNYKATDKSNDGTSQARQRANDGDKMPSLQRAFAKHYTQLEPMSHGTKLDVSNKDQDYWREVNKASSSENWIAETFQFNTMMQIFSPDVMFGNVALYEGLKMRVKGAIESDLTQFWGQTRSANTKEVVREGKTLRGLTPHEIHNNGATKLPILGEINDLADEGLFGPAGPNTEGEMDFYQFNRVYKTYHKGTGRTYPVYGKPDLSERGQGLTTYNNDPSFRFYNSLQPMAVDGGDGQGENSPAITSVNSWGTKCITTVLGPNSKDYDANSRPTLDKLWSESSVGTSDAMLIGELVKNETQIYLGGIYGGNSYEDKSRTNYLEIGEYVDIDVNTIYIDSPGDTFVQTFKYSKLAKTDTEVYGASSMQLTELIEGTIETSINLNNRHDISFTEWDARFQPRDEEYHKYNRVYSQQPTLIQTQDVDYTFRKIKNFDTRIMASKVKVPGENIDGWTDILVNEVQDLNGKNGPINSLVAFKDNIYALQDNAIAAIGINPRVQVQGSDGVAVELGSGGVLHDYKYVTTTSGSINKWGVIPTAHAIYYLDAINKTFNRLAKGIEKLSDVQGLHTWFQNNVDFDYAKVDNPVLREGVNVAYDQINNCVMLTLLQGDNSATRIFNESTNSFMGLMGYKPNRYISNKSNLYMLNDNNAIYEHFKGEYNNFFGEYHSSYITLLVNPDVNYHSVFDNIEYNSEIYLDDVDQHDKTLTHIQAYNEYQDSGRIPLELGRSKNLRRKFRTWRADIPRDGRNRMRNPWVYLKLELDNKSNYKMILHDIIVAYTVS